MTTQSVWAHALSGHALDWAVAKCEGMHLEQDPKGPVMPAYSGWWCWNDAIGAYHVVGMEYSPSTDWGVGGPILEREKMLVSPYSLNEQGESEEGWAVAPRYGMSGPPSYGPTPLVAAMRCYVKSKLGDTVEIPEDVL